MPNLQIYQNKIQQAKGRYEALITQKEKTEKSLSEIIIRSKALEEAQAFIQIVAKDTQEQLKFNIVDVVQLCLDTCFPGQYQFDIVFETKRGRTEAALLFYMAGTTTAIDPMEASGGGVVDLVSFALRISAWSLGHSDNVLIFDEPFRFLSKDLQPRAGEIMHKLARHLKLQIILVSHNQDIIDCADRIFEVTQKNGISKVIVKDNE